MASSPTPALAAVTIKLPTLWTVNLEAWFQHPEAQFALQNVTSSDTHVVSALDAPTALRVAPFLSNSSTLHNYAELKTLLLETFGLSDDEQAPSSTSITKLGDHCLSELMDHMLLLQGHEEPNFLLQHAFKRLIQHAVCHALAAFPTINPRTWSREADQLMVIHEECFPFSTAAPAPYPAHALPLPLIEASPVLAASAPPNC